MTLTEEKRDLFSVDDSYFVAHCISSDIKMGAGIAPLIDTAFGVKSRMERMYGDTILRDFRKIEERDGYCGMCIVVGRVLNLITKKNYWEKPTYSSMRLALKRMRYECMANGISKVAMPRIGCGLDKLDWGVVREMIIEVFDDTDIDILVCVLK